MMIKQFLMIQLACERLRPQNGTMLPFGLDLQILFKKSRTSTNVHFLVGILYELFYCSNILYILQNLNCRK